MNRGLLLLCFCILLVFLHLVVVNKIGFNFDQCWCNSENLKNILFLFLSCKCEGGGCCNSMCHLKLKFAMHVTPQRLLIYYLLDAMHCEKNLCENMIKIVLGLNDSYGSKEDMRKLGIREDL